VLRIRVSSDPDPDPGHNKSPYLNFFGVCKSHKTLRNPCRLTFLFINILFRAYFHKKNFKKKLYYGQDPDSDVFKCRIRIRSKIDRVEEYYV
jgi:hypothetical protein